MEQNFKVQMKLFIHLSKQKYFIFNNFFEKQDVNVKRATL